MCSQARYYRAVFAPVVVGGILLAAGVASADPLPQGLRPSPQTNAPGATSARATDAAPLTPSTPDIKAVQDLLGRATDDLANGKGADLIACMSRADRDRIGAPSDWSDVAKAAEGFRGAWQARFGTTFRLDDKVPVVMAEPAVHIAGLDPTAGGPTTSPAADRKTNASVVLHGPAHRGSTTIKLVNEGNGKPDWHLDLSDTVTARALHDGVIKHLNDVTANQARWPTNVDQAYVHVTEHLLGAIGDAGQAK